MDDSELMFVVGDVGVVVNRVVGLHQALMIVLFVTLFLQT